jgi:WD40 repeat protein
MRQANEAWEAGDLAHLAELLDRHRPADGEADRRGFEWYWLKRCLGVRVGTLKAHDGGLLCAAVSPDDRFLVTADRKGVVKVWDLATLRPVATLTGHTDEVPRAAFSPDGRTLATCGKDRTVRLWDVSTWHERACLRGGHELTVTAVAFSPDGKLLASAGRDRRLILWELPQGRPLRSWLAHRDVVQDVAFTPDGHNLVSVGADRLARFWDVASGGQRECCRCTADPLALALSPDGKILAAGGYDNRLDLYADRTRDRPTTGLKVSWTVRALAFAPWGSQLFAGCDSGMLRVWDVGPGAQGVRPYRAFRVGGGKLRAAVFARRGALLVTASEDDGAVSLWDPARLGGYEVISHLPPAVVAVALSPDGRAASTHKGGKVCAVDLEDRRAEPTLRSLAVACPVALSSDGRTMAAGHGNTQARLWDVASGRRVLTLDHGARVVAVAFSPTDRLIATAGHGGAARLWELPSGALRATCAAGPGNATSLAFAADGRTLAVGSTGHSVTVSLWDPLTGERRGVLTDPGSVAIHRRSAANAPPADEPSLAAESVAFSADGTRLAAACSDGVIRLWDVASGDLRLTLSGHVGTVNRLAFAPDGRTLASLGDDNVIHLWHLGTGQRLFTLHAAAQTLHGLAFSGDGRQLVTGARPLGRVW